MKEIYSCGGAQCSEKDIADIGIAVFRERASGFDEQLGCGGEKGGRQVRKGLLRARPCVGDHDSDRKPSDRGSQDHVQGSVLSVGDVVVERDQRPDVKMEVGRGEIERVKERIQDQQGIVEKE